MSKQKIGVIGFFISLIALFAVISAGAALPPEISTLEAEAVVADGNYYLNSEMGEQFLRRVSNSEIGISVYYASPAIKWTFEGQSDGTFLIRSTYRNTYALYASGSTASLALVPETLTNNYKWRVYTGASGGVLLMNVATGTYLSCDGTTLGLMSKPLASSPTYSRIVWRMPPESYYVNLESFTISTYSILAVDELQYMDITTSPSNATWRNSSNFNWTSSNPSVATVSSTGGVSVVGEGTATITATHKATNATATFSVSTQYAATMIFYTEIQDNDYNELNKTLVYDDEAGGLIVETVRKIPSSKWLFIEQSDGCFSIQLVENREAITLSGESNITLQAFNSSNANQHWEKTSVGNNRYTIQLSDHQSGQSVNENHYLSCTAAASDLYVMHSSDMAEWSLIYNYDAVLLDTLCIDGEDRSSFFGNATIDLLSMGYPNTYHNFGDEQNDAITRDELLAYMTHSKISVIRSHGAVDSVWTTKGDLNLSHLYYIYDEFYDYENITYFSKSQLIIYGMCSAGEGGESAENLVTVTADGGARTVIGFENAVDRFATNEWCEKFIDKMKTYSQNNSTKDLRDICEELNSQANTFVNANRYDYYENGIHVSLRDFVLVGSEDIPEND